MHRYQFVASSTMNFFYKDHFSQMVQLDSYQNCLHPLLNLEAHLVVWRYIMVEDGVLYVMMDLIRLMLM